MKRLICILLFFVLFVAGCERPAEIPPKAVADEEKYLAPPSESSTAEERNYIVSKIVEYEEYLESMKTP